MIHATRWMLVVLGAAALGCTPSIFVTTEPGHCNKDEGELVFALSLWGHAPLLEDDYPDHLCDWDGDGTLSAGERRRMTRVTSHYEVGKAWVELGDHERAIAAFRRDLAGATTVPARVASHVEIAKLLSEAGEHAAAMRELDTAEAGPGDERTTLIVETRVDVLIAAGRRREAIAVLEARPPFRSWWSNTVTHTRIGELWLEEDEEDEAERARVAFEVALAHCEGQPVDRDVLDARMGLARALVKAGHLQQALVALDRVVETHDRDRVWDGHAEAWRLRAAVELALDKPWNAAASVRRAFELEHRYGEPSELAQASHRAELASLHLRAHQPDLAFAGFEAAYRIFERELGPLHQYTLTTAHNLGVACLDLGDLEQAMSWLRVAASGREAVAAEPYELGVTLLQLGNAELRAGLHAEAALTFTAALELLGELDDPRLTDLDRARMYSDAAAAFLDAGLCEQAVATIELAKQFQVQLGEEPSYVDLVGTQPRLEQLRRCWGPNRPGFD